MEWKRNEHVSRTGKALLHAPRLLPAWEQTGIAYEHIVSVASQEVTAW
jgi:hypothetical protein